MQRIFNRELRQIENVSLECLLDETNVLLATISSSSGCIFVVVEHRGPFGVVAVDGAAQVCEGEVCSALM